MKTRIILLSMTLSLTALSCTNKLSDRLEWDQGLMAAIPGYETVNATRVSFSNALTSFYWSNGDCIGVCRSSSTANGTAAFTLLKGGASVGNFINDSFSLIPNSDYYAFYPFTTGVIASEYPIDLTGQIQTANNSIEHIGKFNYMSAGFTADESGKASFTFSNIGAVIQLHFTADMEETYRSLSITSDGSPFTVGASYNLTNGTITPKVSQATFNVSFGEEGIHVYNGESVVISAVILPDDLSQSTLTFSIKNKAGAVVKEMDLAGYAFASGKLYHFYEDDSKGDPPYGGCPDGNHPHAIDLGLPSGTLWSCMNLGAANPLEDGIAFSWGQTYYVEKNDSNWSNYEFMDESLSNQWGITKYQIADNMTDGIWYNGDSFIGDNKTTLEMQDDAARQNWGGKWRMPTRKETEELLNYTYIVETNSYNSTGARGRVFYKKKSNNKYSLWDPHIFLIHDSDGYILSAGTRFYWYGNFYWTSSLGTETGSAFLLRTLQRVDNYYTTSHLDIIQAARTDKNQIRPVQSKNSQ